MSKLVNHYRYKKHYDEIIDENGNYKYLSHNSSLYAVHPGREYKTKMNTGDLPEYYCDVFRGYDMYDIISSKGVVSLYYTWVKENHFMKDSVLHISYSGDLKPYHEKYTYGGKTRTSIFTSYTNEDDMIFGNEIFKFLAYVHKYSICDFSQVRREFVNQCKWLAEHEPAYAPDLENFKNYGEWFDDKIKIENYDN